MGLQINVNFSRRFLKDICGVHQRFSEEIPAILDDNQSKLSVMKSSKYVISFLAEVDMWEKVLSIILESVEMLTQVQKLWMYLEVSVDHAINSNY